MWTPGSSQEAGGSRAHPSCSEDVERKKEVCSSEGGCSAPAGQVESQGRGEEAEESFYGCCQMSGESTGLCQGNDSEEEILEVEKGSCDAASFAENED